MQNLLSTPDIRALLACTLAAVLAACAERTTPQSTDVSAQPSAPATQAQEGAPASPTPTTPQSPAAVGDGAAIPEEVVLSTNEPFWTAQVEGQILTLSGADFPERKLPITRSQMQGQTRVITAGDADNQIELKVRADKCEDSMSAAQFPFSGELRLAEADAAISGCARPAAMPAPKPPGADAPTQSENVGSAQATIPEVFRGHWAPDQDGCRNPDSTIEGLRVSARELRFHESIGVPSAVRQVDANTAELTMDYEGEGQTWTSNQTLRIEGGNRMTIIGPDDFSMTRIRCNSDS